MNNKDQIFLNSLQEFKDSIYSAYKIRFDNLKIPNDVYSLAVTLAYKDLQWRTIKNHNNNRKDFNIRKITELIKDNIENGGDHTKLIDDVGMLFYLDVGDAGLDQCIGKAQKVVNMSFKYLYCIKSPLMKINYENRDIPLDDRILDFYYSYRKARKLSIKNRIYSWSKIKIETYIDIQKDLKEYTKDIGLDMNPIEAEFILWNYSTTKLVLDSYKSIKKSYDKVIANKPLIDSFAFIESKIK